MIYFDHNATTPLAPEVLERMLPFLQDSYGNASSIHAAGQRARHAVDDAREQVCAALQCLPKEIVFTSGGTEANNLALRGAYAARPPNRHRIVTTSVEHPSVLDTVRALDPEAVLLRVDSAGRLDWNEVESALTPETALVSVMWANNETGVLFPAERIGLLCRERGIPFHVDAVQVAGKLPIDLSRLPADLLSLSAHKFGGPQGAGALFIRRRFPFRPLQTGGAQELGRRGGTENVAAIVGLGAALELAPHDDLAPLRDALERAILASVSETRVIGGETERLGSTTSLCFRHVDGEGLLMALDLAGICASSGSACSSGSLEPSHVLRAMGITPEWARGAVRFSLGPTNTTAEVEVVAQAVARAVYTLRRPH